MIKIKINKLGGGRKLREGLRQKKFEKCEINLIRLELLSKEDKINEVIIEIYPKSVLMTTFRVYTLTSRPNVNEWYLFLWFCPHFWFLFQGEIIIFKFLLIRIENRVISNLNSVPIEIECCCEFLCSLEPLVGIFFKEFQEYG